MTLNKKETEKYILNLYNRLEDLIVHKLCIEFNITKKQISNYKDRIRIEKGKVFVDDKLFLSLTDMSITNPRIESSSVDLGVKVKIYD